MNKLGVTTLEGKVQVYDMRTYHNESGYAGLTESLGVSTLWGVIFYIFCSKLIKLKLFDR